MKREYDVIVIGGGHAGIEAAYAAVRAGARTALVTLAIDKIGEMSCNPAIGGLAKGQMVCEIDALGGLMGQAIDATGTQYRMLNKSKGPAVWGPRAQADKVKYAKFTREFMENLEGLDVIEGEASEILAGDEVGCPVSGVVLKGGEVLSTKAAIITGGTFLNGLIHIGEKRISAGRMGESAASLLTDSLRKLGMEIGRLKTGTCPRLAKDSVDWDRCEVLPADENPVPFSMLTDRIVADTLPCYTTKTNAKTHSIIRDNLDRAPLYSGQINSTGPRYCPSIEVKIVRFADKDQHLIHLEPESEDYDWIYCNGLATSIPEDLQLAMVHSIAGLENAKIEQWGYAIEYDFVFPNQLSADLQSKVAAGLFFAGQINGTSGYEEAAAQGLMAGVNAVRYLQNKSPIVLRRDQAYIGVMIDDLVTKGVDEPYRMFTSRAEFRLLLRADTAERRLCPIAEELGILDPLRVKKHHDWNDQRARLTKILSEQKLEGVSLEHWLRKPENTWAKLVENVDAGMFDDFDDAICRQIEADVKYAGYYRREFKAAEKLQKLEAVKLSRDLDYFTVHGIKYESQEKLNAVKPITLAQASRISGITPADIMVLMVFLGKA